MHARLDDLVTAPYVTVDELLEPRRGPGRPPRLSDAELLCLAVAQVLLGYRSERRSSREAKNASRSSRRAWVTVRSSAARKTVSCLTASR